MMLLIVMKMIIIMLTTTCICNFDFDNIADCDAGYRLRRSERVPGQVAEAGGRQRATGARQAQQDVPYHAGGSHRHRRAWRVPISLSLVCVYVYVCVCVCVCLCVCM